MREKREMTVWVWKGKENERNEWGERWKDWKVEEKDRTERLKGRLIEDIETTGHL